MVYGSEMRCTRPLARILSAALWALVLGAILQGCGYHLKGSTQTLSSLPPTLVKGDESTALNGEVRQVLRNMKTPVVDDVSQAVLVINLSPEKKERRILSVNASGRAEEYELIYSFVYDVTDAKGKVLVNSQVIRQILAIQFDETQVNSIVSESEQLYDDMRRSAVRDLARRLQKFSDMGGTDIQ
ncbi:MAG TPA: hypothetical protein ENJ22_02355 [Gammaproteobacteria bacterium]|nr:hypothetical protein [Gammaproteobacteria bacterium]